MDQSHDGARGAVLPEPDSNPHSNASSLEATARSDDSIRTPRTDGYLSIPPKESVAEALDEPDAFNSMANRKSSSGFLASLTASDISSPLQSTYASSASLQSSGDQVIGQVTMPHMGAASGAAEPAPVHSASSPPAPPTYMASSPARPLALSATTSPNRRDRPRYPDQSYAALHIQPITLPYAYLKSRSSDYSARHPMSVSPGYSSDRLSAASGPSAADYAPLPSPGLFQPKANKGLTEPSGPSLLHPTHRAHVTKETNKLIKDFDQVTGNKIMNDYEVLEKLGTGSYGAVKRARNLVTSQDVAIKILRRTGRKGRLGKNESPEDKIKKEVAVLKKARHPQIVSLLEVIDDPESQKVYLVLEYVERGEIIWRTHTTRNIARFEMERVARELMGTGEETTEHELLVKFNDEVRRNAVLSQAASRRQTAPARRLDEPFRMGHEAPIFPDADAFADMQSANEIIHGWSNEVGGNESEAEQESRAQRAVRRSAWAPPSALETPRATVGAPSQSGTEAFPELGASLAGSQYGPYAGDEEDYWTAEENGFKYVPCMTMSQARDAFRDTVLGLEYLHYHGIIHRDIKPANLLWTRNYRVKISDFGVSYVGEPVRNRGHEAREPASNNDEERELAKTVGTPAFYAPELCDPAKWDTDGSSDRHKVTGQIDIWALGVTLYAMIYGRLPFFDESDEFAMYEKIARAEAFLSSKRLEAGCGEPVREAGRSKRAPPVLAYEAVDDDLKDLLRRLLDKDPTTRATLQEIKHHPWLLFGLEDPEKWVAETDPGLQSDGKIEVSKTDVEVAIAPLNLVDRIKHGIRRLGSVVTRGRESRRRAESSVKDTNNHSGSNSSRSTTMDRDVRDARRPSLRGDEQIYSALRASRETYDHPLSQSVMASPAVERSDPLFVAPIAVETSTNVSGSGGMTASRPATERQESATESVRTLRAPLPTPLSGAMPSNGPISEDPPETPSAASSSSGLSNLLGVASRRLASTMRRDRATSSRGSSRSSRASSADNIAHLGLVDDRHDPHALPSVALSPAVAAGHVDCDFFGPDAGNANVHVPGHAQVSAPASSHAHVAVPAHVHTYAPMHAPGPAASLLATAETITACPTPARAPADPASGAGTRIDDEGYHGDGDGSGNGDGETEVEGDRNESDDEGIVMGPRR